jgi:hypothetical protein
MNTCNTQPESYHHRVSNNTLAPVKRQIQQVENPTHAMVIRVEAAPVEDAILLDNLTSEVGLEEPEIGCTGPNIMIENNYNDDKLHSEMPGCRGDYKDESDESDERDAIPTTGWQRLASTEL